MKAIFFSTAALLLAAAPAQAQLLGGGLGGTVGGTLRGAGSLDLPTRPVETVTRSTGSVRGSTEGSQSVDRRSGRVSTRRSASAQGSGAADQAIASPLGNLTGSGSGNAQAGGSGQADAQLIGTDAVRGLAGSAVGMARGTVSAAGNAAANAAGRVQGAAGSASGSASGAASGMFSGAAGQLALAGSAAGQGAGTFDIVPGMPVTDDEGNRVGFVGQIITDGRGRVEQLTVVTEDGPATVPADNFTGSGSLLISAMGEGKLEKTARKQADQD